MKKLTAEWVAKAAMPTPAAHSPLTRPRCRPIRPRESLIFRKSVPVSAGKGSSPSPTTVGCISAVVLPGGGMVGPDGGQKNAQRTAFVVADRDAARLGPPNLRRLGHLIAAGGSQAIIAGPLPAAGRCSASRGRRPRYFARSPAGGKGTCRA